MNRFLLFVVMLTASAFASLAIADEAKLPPDPLANADTAVVAQADAKVDANAKADPAYGVKYTQEQVVNLPQDQNKFYTTIIGTPGEAKFEAIKAWFEKVPELKAVRAQTHWNEIQTTSTMFKERYASTLKNTPCVRVQSADGTTLYQCSGDNVPMSGEALTKAINTECLRRWRKNNKGPNPDTTPDTTPAPDTDNPDVQPDTTPNTPDTQPDTIADEAYRFPWLLVGGTSLAGLIIGAGSMVVTLYRKKYLAPPPK